MGLKKNQDSLILIASVTVVIFLTLMWGAWGAGQTTPFENFAGYRGTAANFTSVLQAIGAENATCATQGAAANMQYFNYFGFGLPVNATIHGITVRIFASVSAGSENWTIHLRKTQGGSDSGGRAKTISSNAACGAGQTFYDFGGPTDLWNTTWTPAQVNNLDFGVHMMLPAAAVTRRINSIQLQINYTEPVYTSTTTTTTTNTTTITAATCLNCGGAGGSMALLAAIVVGLIVVVAVAARQR